MKRLLNFFRPKPLIINVEHFGPRLPFIDVQATFKGKADDVPYRAIMQLCEFQRQLCQSAVEDKSNVLNGQTQFEAGGAAAMAEVMRTLQNLELGLDNDPQLRLWFA
jgi:hypothetical protein